MPQKSQIVTFHLASPELRAWVVVQGEHQAPLVVEMFQGRPGDWSASAWLIPGQYRCRFYRGNERNVTYHGPAAILASHEATMNAPINTATAAAKDAATPAPITSSDTSMDALICVRITPEAVARKAVTILLVEDNLDTLDAYSRLLRMDGHIVHTADGYQAALDVAKHERLDLAVCDIGLWDGDGCALLKELQELQSLKAIAVTGSTLPDEVDDYRAAGFAAVLPKPLIHSQIALAIAELGQTGAMS